MGGYKNIKHLLESGRAHGASVLSLCLLSSYHISMMNNNLRRIQSDVTELN